MIGQSTSDNAVVISHENFSWGLKNEEDEETKDGDKKKKKGNKIEKQEILEEDKSMVTVALDQSKNG